MNDEVTNLRTSSGQNDAERRALAGMSIYLHLPAVRGDDGADKAEAESEPGLAADVTAIKAIPDVIDVLGRDAGPGVCDGDCDRAKARSYGTRSVHVRARPCVDRDAAT